MKAPLQILLALLLLCLAHVCFGQTPTRTPTRTPTPTATITATPTITPTLGYSDVYWIGGTGNWTDSAHWSLTSGGAGGVAPPLCNGRQGQVNCHFDSNSFTGAGQTVTTSGADRCCIDFDAGSAPDAPTFDAGFSGLLVSGSLSLPTGVTFVNLNELDLNALSGSHTVTSNGYTYGNLVYFGPFEASTAIWSLTDDFNVDSAVSAPGAYFDHGTLTTNGHALSAPGFWLANGGPSDFTLNAGSSHITVTNDGWLSIGTGDITFNAGTSTLELNGVTNTVSITLGNGGSRVYYEVWVRMPSGNAGVINEESSYHIFKADPDTEVDFYYNSTVDIWDVTGTAGHLVVINGFNDTVTFTSEAISDYVNMTNNHCAGVTPCYAGSHSVDGGGNTNWLFVDAPVTPTPTETETGATHTPTLTPTFTPTRTTTRTWTPSPTPTTTHTCDSNITVDSIMAGAGSISVDHTIPITHGILIAAAGNDLRTTSATDTQGNNYEGGGIFAGDESGSAGAAWLYSIVRPRESPGNTIRINHELTNGDVITITPAPKTAWALDVSAGACLPRTNVSCAGSPMLVGNPNCAPSDTHPGCELCCSPFSSVPNFGTATFAPWDQPGQWGNTFPDPGLPVCGDSCAYPGNEGTWPCKWAFNPPTGGYLYSCNNANALRFTAICADGSIDSGNPEVIGFSVSDIQGGADPWMQPLPAAGCTGTNCAPTSPGVTSAVPLVAPGDGAWDTVLSLGDDTLKIKNSLTSNIWTGWSQPDYGKFGAELPTLLMPGTQFVPGTPEPTATPGGPTNTPLPTNTPFFTPVLPTPIPTLPATATPAGVCVTPTAIVSPTPTFGPTPACCGACTNPNVVTAHDVQICTNILHGSPLDDCPACDCDGSGTMTVGDLSIVMSNEQNGCPVPPTATPRSCVTVTPSPLHRCAVFTPTPIATATPCLVMTPVKIFAVPRHGEVDVAENQFNKEPDETFAIACMFSREMRHDERIVVAEVHSHTLFGVNCGPDDGVVGCSGIDEQRIITVVHDGTDGCGYQITMKETANSGRVLICNMRMDVHNVDLGP